MFASHDQAPSPVTLRLALERILRPAVGFQHPREVLKDPLLSPDDKRAVLSSWASDACAVEDQPTLRQMVGCESPVPLEDVLAALSRLDGPGPHLKAA
ncbi:hypothetical protein [Phenylobacterium sp.]|uniref:hypothetical protein n=1 Tax=Phenylobacterium sp. TaxID=1871053 RepID=UPI003BAB7A31